MYKIFIDTTTRYKKKVILIKNGIELEKLEGEIDIVASIKKILETNNLTLNNIEEIVTNPGPGSFTGIKIGITIANTLNWISGKKDMKNLCKPKYGREPNIQQP